MAREVDEKARRKALSRIRRAKAAVERAIARADSPDAAEAARAELTDWEAEFMASVEQRLNEYGSAYADPTLGGDGEALSRLQVAKLKEIEKKASGKAPGGFRKGGAASSFKNKASGFNKRGAASRASSRDINADMDEAQSDAAPAPDPLGELEESGQIRRGLGVIEGGADSATPGEGGAPRLRIIKGGKGDE